MLHREDREQTTVLRLEHGKANALDAELCEALTERLAEIESQPGSRAVVLTGSGGIFSAGVDLFRVLQAEETYLDRFLPALRGAFRTVATFPKPVVAAVNGHAIAGGCVLVCACDHRIMARGEGVIGVPELRVGVPFPGDIIDIVRRATPVDRHREIILGGRNYPPDQALERGLVDELADPDALLERAIEAARELTSIPAAVYALTKRQLATDRAGEDAELMEEVVATWKAPETHARIRDWLERSLGRGGRGD